MRARIFTDQFLLISEEQALVYSQLEEHDKAFNNIESAFKALETLRQIGFAKRVGLSIESRLIRDPWGKYRLEKTQR